jgi:hypothetical protein
MSVVGCDFGTVNTVVAVARNRGVDVVRTQTPLHFYLYTFKSLREMRQTWFIHHVESSHNTCPLLLTIPVLSKNQPDRTTNITL